MAAKKHNAGGELILGIIAAVIGGWLLIKFGPKVASALRSGTATGSGLTLGGSAAGAARQASTSPLYLPGSSGGGSGSGVSADLGKIGSAIASLFSRKGTETVAQALQRGDYTSQNQGVLASIFNLQQYGNPYGDSRDTTLAAFGLSSSPIDSLLSAINNAGVGTQQPLGSLDFANYGANPWDFSNSYSDWIDSILGPTTQTTDTGYIDQQQPTLFDFGSWGQPVDQAPQQGTYQGYYPWTSDYTGDAPVATTDPGYDPFAGYAYAADQTGSGYLDGLNTSDPWGTGQNTTYYYL